MSRVDWRDALLVVGLAMMGAGLWLFDYRWALVGMGAIMALLAIVSVTRR